MIVTVLILLFFSFVSTSDGTLSPKNSKKPSVRLGPIDESVFDRNLVSESPSAKEILNNHQAYSSNTSRRSTDGMVLGYVTPWNNHGYDVAKTFAGKFTHISPVWLQVRRAGKERYEVTGTHDVDKGWMKDVRSRGNRVKIVPRVLFDQWPSRDLERLLSGPAAERQALTAALVAACRTWRFDGLVVEVWSQLAGRAAPEQLVGLARHVGGALLGAALDAVLVVPPSRAEQGAPGDPFTADHLERLRPHWTAFSLMTYDYSSAQRPGPNSPLGWARRCVQALVPEPGAARSQLLAGLNLYGYDFTAQGGGPIVAGQYLQLLARLKGRLSYDPQSAEHYFEVKDQYGRHTVFYPTLLSLSERLRAARDLGTGLSLWELGQGLDYFYDLL